MAYYVNEKDEDNGKQAIDILLTVVQKK